MPYPIKHFSLRLFFISREFWSGYLVLTGCTGIPYTRFKDIIGQNKNNHLENWKIIFNAKFCSTSAAKLMQHAYISCTFIKLDLSENRGVNSYIISSYNTSQPLRKDKKPYRDDEDSA